LNNGREAARIKKRNRLNQSVIVIVNVKNYYKNKKVEPYGSVL